MKKAIISSLLLVSQRLGENIIGLVSTLILARLLSPQDFGLIASATLIIWLLSTLTDAGTEQYILQKETVSEEELDSAWTLDFILKSIVFLLICAVSPLASYYFGNDDVSLIIISMSVLMVIAAFNNPGLWLLKREQNYKKIVFTSLFAKFFTLFVSIPLALYLNNHWALIIAQIFYSSFKMISSHVITKRRLKFCTKHIAKQWNFSKWLVPQALVGYFRIHIDALIVGKRFGTEDLGGYNTTKYLSTFPSNHFVGPLLAPFHVEISKASNNLHEMKYIFNLTTKVIGFLVAPIIATLYIGSGEVIEILLGSKWAPYSDIFATLVLLTIPAILLSQASRMLMIKERTKSIFYFEIVSTISISCLLILLPITGLLNFSIARVSIDFLICSGIFFYVNQSIFKSLNLKSFLILITPTVLSIVTCFIAVNSIDIGSNHFLNLLSVSFIAFVTTALCALAIYAFEMTEREKILFSRLVNLAKLKMK